ncbi:MAG: flagellin FliC [Deltaproteobacteria bacterium]|nr:flagellin FliC [Deltaproteobacteria bacterium]
MGMSIRTNVASLNAQRNLFQTQSSLDSSLSKLSSGYRITKAGDDAAGLGISVNLEAQIRIYSQAARNAQDGISVVQTGEGAMNEVSNILTRMRELAMESASDGVTDTERAYIQEENSALITEIGRIAAATEFNGTKLLDTAGTALTFQVGIRNVAANDRITLSTVDVTASTLGVDGLSLSSAASSRAALDTIDDALKDISKARATFGATGNRMSNVIAQIQSAAENLSAANSRIRDVDVAEESSRMTRSQILMQAGVSVLAQANQQPQVALKLIG